MSQGRAWHRSLAVGTPAALGTLLLVGCGGTLAGPADPIPAADLASRIEAVLATPPLDRVHWGVVVAEADGGAPLYERNADLLFIPGSNAKVPAVAAALDRLGASFRWETSAYSRHRPNDGLVDGDVYVVGRGDPSLGPPFHESGTAALHVLVDSMAAAGIERIGGRIVVDVSAWDSTTVPDSWMVEDLPVTPGATGGAFSIALGELEIRVAGAERAGLGADVDWEPLGRTPGAEPFVSFDVTTSDPGSDVELTAMFRPDSRQWRIEGSVPAGETTILRRSARSPVRLAAATLHQALVDRGIDVTDVEIAWDAGAAVEDTCRTGALPSCPGMLRLAGVASPPLPAIAAEILGPSQNWMAEQLLRTLGLEAGEGPGGWPAGIEAMTRFLVDEVGLSESDFHLEDGSGLSNHNLISPAALVGLLQHARGQTWGDTFREALASPGEEDTTLENRLQELEGRLAAKTGSLSHVNSLSGYVETSDGRTLAFSILSNGANLPASEVRAGIDRVVRAIAGP